MNRRVKTLIVVFSLLFSIFLVDSFLNTSVTQISGKNNPQEEVLSDNPIQEKIHKTETKSELDKAPDLLPQDQLIPAPVSRGKGDRINDMKSPAPSPEKNAAPIVEEEKKEAEKPVIKKTAEAPKPKAATEKKTAEAPKPKAATQKKPDDLDLLARLITAEAQGEPYDAQVAVGAVVVNRVKSDSFPNTINEVIYQNIEGYYQFTPVVNGWINKPAKQECVNAAKEALNGSDPTNGALFYYDNTTTNPWILAKPVSIRIGNMIYAY